MLQRWTYLLSVLGVGGAALNVAGSPWCWPLWTAANLGWLAWSIRRKVWPQTAVWSCFLATSAWGWMGWIGG